MTQRERELQALVNRLENNNRHLGEQIDDLKKRLSDVVVTAEGPYFKGEKITAETLWGFQEWWKAYEWFKSRGDLPRWM